MVIDFVGLSVLNLTANGGPEGEYSAATLIQLNQYSYGTVDIATSNLALFKQTIVVEDNTLSQLLYAHVHIYMYLDYDDYSLEYMQSSIYHNIPRI